MKFITDLVQALFAGIDPVKIALWVRGFFAALFGGIGAGAIDVLVQILAQLQTAEAFHVDWILVARTVAIAALPVLIAYLKTPKSNDGVIYADHEK